eukprot:TRINITY_DN12236_c0_g1_i1.p1 TRINITY_DN12236_c0_g1~~TRINITY_DN12236_c0_g1_i1.p1  ORF type:complete len:377 (+),score=80.98 TRINITY_DN12236_c0_g1_i1:40-1131(+)
MFKARTRETSTIDDKFHSKRKASKREPNKFRKSSEAATYLCMLPVMVGDMFSADNKDAVRIKHALSALLAMPTREVGDYVRLPELEDFAGTLLDIEVELSHLPHCIISVPEDLKEVLEGLQGVHEFLHQPGFRLEMLPCNTTHIKTIYREGEKKNIDPKKCIRRIYVQLCGEKGKRPQGYVRWGEHWVKKVYGIFQRDEGSEEVLIFENMRTFRNTGPNTKRSYVLPGGDIAPKDETVADAAKREFLEEMGVEIDIPPDATCLFDKNGTDALYILMGHCPAVGHIVGRPTEAVEGSIVQQCEDSHVAWRNYNSDPSAPCPKEAKEASWVNRHITKDMTHCTHRALTDKGKMLRGPLVPPSATP